jgi:hypothetical protein
MAKCVLSKHELASIGDGGAPMNRWIVFMYRVHGMLNGEEAFLYNQHTPSRDPSWQYRRVKGSEYSDWKGAFRSADEALTALEHELNAVI